MKNVTCIESFSSSNIEFKKGNPYLVDNEGVIYVIVDKLNNSIGLNKEQFERYFKINNN